MNKPAGPDRGPETLEVPESEAGSRLDRFLRKRYPRLPQGFLQKSLRKGGITLNRKRAGAAERLEGGDRIELWARLDDFRPSAREEARALEKLKRDRGFQRHFRILHEDEAIIALDKPAGRVVHPAQGHHGGDTLLDLLRLHLPGLYTDTSDYRPAFIHRLDRGTSGVIVAAKTREAARSLELAFRERRVRKTYLALARGSLRDDRGTIDLEIRRRGKPTGPTRYWATREKKQRSTDEPSRFKEARTSFEVVERLPGATLLRIDLGTGRTHQIRVHLAALGHPLVGDGDYGDRALNRRIRETTGPQRLFLHAHELEIPHPDTGKTLTLRAELPEDLEGILNAMRRKRPS